jgi:hypothetical protein
VEPCAIDSGRIQTTIVALGTLFILVKLGEINMIALIILSKTHLSQGKILAILSTSI